MFVVLEYITFSSKFVFFKKKIFTEGIPYFRMIKSWHRKLLPSIRDSSPVRAFSQSLDCNYSTTQARIIGNNGGHDFLQDWDNATNLMIAPLINKLNHKCFCIRFYTQIWGTSQVGNNSLHLRNMDTTPHLTRINDKSAVCSTRCTHVCSSETTEPQSSQRFAHHTRTNSPINPDTNRSTEASYFIPTDTARLYKKTTSFRYSQWLPQLIRQWNKSLAVMYSIQIQHLLAYKYTTGTEIKHSARQVFWYLLHQHGRESLQGCLCSSHQSLQGRKANESSSTATPWASKVQDCTHCDERHHFGTCQGFVTAPRSWSQVDATQCVN